MNPLQVEIISTEKEINNLVYKIYNLNEEEIAIIENKVDNI
ncbi:hypothetical protein [Methanobrevibacter filiformis]|nr:hypothetical protein [Methanobrevibacter filiformis]